MWDDATASDQAIAGERRGGGVDREDGGARPHAPARHRRSRRARAGHLGALVDTHAALETGRARPRRAGPAVPSPPRDTARPRRPGSGTPARPRRPWGCRPRRRVDPRGAAAATPSQEPSWGSVVATSSFGASEPGVDPVRSHQAPIARTAPSAASRPRAPPRGRPGPGPSGRRPTAFARSRRCGRSARARRPRPRGRAPRAPGSCRELPCGPEPEVAAADDGHVGLVSPSSGGVGVDLSCFLEPPAGAGVAHQAGAESRRASAILHAMTVATAIETSRVQKRGEPSEGRAERHDHRGSDAGRRRGALRGRSSTAPATRNPIHRAMSRPVSNSSRNEPGDGSDRVERAQREDEESLRSHQSFAARSGHVA